MAGKPTTQVIPGFGDRVAALLRRHPRINTAVALGREAGVSRQTLHRALNEDSLTLDTMRAIASALGVPMAELQAPEYPAAPVRRVREPSPVYAVYPGQFPRHVEGLVKRMEADIYDADIPEPLRDGLLYALRNQDLVTMYRMGWEERRETAEEQRQRMETHVAVIRDLLEQMVADVQREKRRS